MLSLATATAAAVLKSRTTALCCMLLAPLSVASADKNRAPSDDSAREAEEKKS
jgi:hypothetical protein